MRPLATRRDCLRLAAAGLFAAALPITAEEAPGYDLIDFDWVDSSRQRAVPTRLYLPQTPQRVPLMVFSHGIGGSRMGYSWLGRYMAGRGVASLHLQHVGSDRQLWSGGNVFNIVGRLQAAAQDGEAIHRAQDLRFALDTLLSAAHDAKLAARIDGQRILAAGHSYGANTTLLACGARVQRQGRVIDLHDARVRAAVAISAPPFYGDPDPRPILAGIRVPTLHVTATEDVIRIPGYFSGAEDRVALFEATGGPRKWLAVYEGGSHSMFTDRAGTGGVALNPQVKAATQALVLAFTRSVFDGDETELLAWPQRHAALLARFSTAAG